jgi:ATP-dependent DNA helicase PIF1
MELSVNDERALAAPAPQLPAPFDPKYGMSDEQFEAAEDIVDNPELNYFVTGEAGTGKTHVIKGLRRMTACTVCATTARAALLIGGTTVDRVFNMNRDGYEVRDFAQLAKTMERVHNTIIIDEASMSGHKMSDCIYDVLKMYRKRVVLVGDMAQASPVKDDWGTKSKLFKEAKLIKLRHVHRQDDGEFLKGLSKLRMGIIDDNIRELFATRIVGPALNDPSFDGHVRMYATNKGAADYNMLRFEALQNNSPESRLFAEYNDLRDFYLQNKWPVSDAQIRTAFEACRLAHDEWVKIGARVLFTVNDNVNGQYVNGDVGVVTDVIYDQNKKFSDTMNGRQVEQKKVYLIKVRMDRYDREIAVCRVSQEFKDAAGRPAYSLTGFPVRLGWALTIHKSQGMTLDNAFVNMNSIMAMPGESRHGLAYVALSRTRTLAGLAIDGWNDQAVYCSKEVYAYL